MKIKFTISGSPIGWQRTGYNRYTGAKYTQEKTRNHEQHIAWEYRKVCGNFRFPKGTPLEMEVFAFLEIPKSESKKKKSQMLSGEIRPMVKPDFDNIGKLIADALNNIAYDDDKCIVDGIVRKYYSDVPRTVVILREATSLIGNIKK